MSDQKHSVNRVLPSPQDFEMSDLQRTTFKQVKTTKVPDTGTIQETKERSVPIIVAGATKHLVLYSITQPYNAKEALGWTTGQKLFDNIEEIFGDPSDLKYWRQLLTTNNPRPVQQSKSFINNSGKESVHGLHSCSCSAIS